MSEARVTKVVSSLARQVFEPGGRTVRDALRKAGEELEVHREPVMATIAATLDELDAVEATGVPNAGPRVYELASAIVGLGGYFDLGPLNEAAYSLCDISDRMIGADAWHWPSVNVHLQAMRLILSGGCREGKMSDALLEGLHAVSQRPIGAEEASRQ
ncbi:MAG: chemotaxis protein CheE [Brevundimonas sp.]|nr:chemotaxis protein CheE [Brevundimonas sp.]